LIATISMLMMVSMAFIIYTPFVIAHKPPWQIPTFAYVSVAANPVGKGQTVLIYMWLDKCPPTATGPWGDRWEGFTLKNNKA
jgi:hypothetical protein